MAEWELPSSESSGKSPTKSANDPMPLMSVPLASRPPCASAPVTPPVPQVAAQPSHDGSSRPQVTDRSRSPPNRSLSNHSPGSPRRQGILHRARVLMRSATADPPPRVPGAEFWQHPLWNFAADARSRLPREQYRSLRWVFPCGGAGSEIAMAEATHCTRADLRFLSCQHVKIGPMPKWQKHCPQHRICVYGVLASGQTSTHGTLHCVFQFATPGWPAGLRFHTKESTRHRFFTFTSRNTRCFEKQVLLFFACVSWSFSFPAGVAWSQGCDGLRFTHTHPLQDTGSGQPT